MNSAIQILSRSYRHPWILLATLLMVTLLALVSAGTLQINSTPYMIDKSHPSRVADHDTKRLFSNTGEQAFVAVENAQGDIFNPKSLETVQRLTRAFESMTLVQPADEERLRSLQGYEGLHEVVEGILANGLRPADVHRLPELRAAMDQAGLLTADRADWLDTLEVRLDPVRKVRSLVTMENMQPFDGGLDVGPLMAQLPTTSQERAALRREVLENPLFINGLISPEGNATTVQVELNISEDDSPSMLLAYEALSEVIAAIETNDRIYLSGPPMIASQTAANMEQDNATLLPGVLLVILVVLMISFGRVQGVLAPMIIAILSLFWTLGLMAAFGVKQNIVTSMLPVFIVAIAVCDAIHFLSNYYRQLPANPDRQARTEAAIGTMRTLFWPMFVTTITTMAGFFALAWTEVIFIREFGIFVGLGVFVAWLVTMLFLPALLIIWKARPPRFGLLTSNGLDRLMANFGNFAGHGKTAVYAVVALAVVGGIYTTQALNVDNQVIGYFEEDTQIRIDDAAINANFGGTTPISILFETDQVDAFKQPAMIEAIDKIQEQLRQNPLVGYTYSPADFLKRLHQVTSEDTSSASYRLPDNMSNSLVAQYFLLYENANGRDLFDVMDRRFQSGRILAVLHTDRSSEVSGVIDATMALAQEVLPAGTSVRVSGYGEILVATTDAVVWGQVQSLVLAVLAIAVVVMLALKSLRLGLLAMLPLLFTLVTVFTLMALTGTDLDIGTSIIAAISFGIGIDYAVHTIAALRNAQGREHVAMIRAGLQHCGKPILINTLALGLGFLVLTLSGYQALVNLGYFISLTMVFSALFALLVLPAFVAGKARQRPVGATVPDSPDTAEVSHANA